jgi:hypothetical protein
MLWTYDPKRVTVSVHVYPISGFADGTFVTVEAPDDYTRVDGCDGVVTRVRNQIQAGVLRLTLAQSSSSNQVLDLLRAYMAAGVWPQVPVEVADLNGGMIGGNSRITCVGSWIKSAPAISFGKELNTREWTFDCTKMTVTVGGAKLTVL